MKRGQVYLFLVFILAVGFKTTICTSANPSITIPDTIIAYPAGAEQAELIFSVTLQETNDLHFKLYDMQYNDLSFSHGYISGFAGSYSFTQTIAIIQGETTDWYTMRTSQQAPILLSLYTLFRAQHKAHILSMEELISDQKHQRPMNLNGAAY